MDFYLQFNIFHALIGAKLLPKDAHEVEFFSFFTISFIINLLQKENANFELLPLVNITTNLFYRKNRELFVLN